MPQTDTSPTLTATQRAIALVEQLPADKLTIALTFLENLTQNRMKRLYCKSSSNNPASIGPASKNCAIAVNMVI